MPLSKQQNNPSYVVAETTTYRVGIKSVRVYHAFLDAPNRETSSSAATTLLFHLDKCRCEQWNVTINFIDFSHSSNLAWSTPNRLTGRPRHTLSQMSHFSDSITSQIVRNGILPVRDFESARLKASEVSNLWRVLTPEGQNFSSNFTIEELTSASST